MSNEKSWCYIWPRAVPENLCDLIVEEGLKLDLQPGATGRPGNRVVDRSARNVDTERWPSSHWITGLLMHYVTQANKKQWQFDIRTVEGAVFLEYEPGGRYLWHSDKVTYDNEYTPDPDWQGLARRLTISINLTDPKDYDGGFLLYRDEDGNELLGVVELAQMKQKGSAMIFLSDMMHTLSEITRGSRHALLTCALGPENA